MRKLRITTFGMLMSTGLLLTSCSNTRQVQNTTKTKKRFIDDIALAGNSTSKVNTTSGSRPGSRRNTIVDTIDAIITPVQMKYASMLRVVPQSITNHDLYNFIDDWYGVRYRYGGNDKTGIDCSAFVQRVYETVFCTNVVRTSIEQFGSCHMVWNIDSLQEGDLVFFRTRGKRISHVGIYLKNNFFVHAASSRGVMISSLSEDYWTRRYAGAGQIPKAKPYNKM